MTLTIPTINLRRSGWSQRAAGVTSPTRSRVTRPYAGETSEWLRRMWDGAGA